MSKILVTGGAGYIGSHTVVELELAGFDTIIIDNFSNSTKSVILALEKLLNKKITYYEGNCSDKNFLQDLFTKEKNIEGIIHFAAFKAVGESEQFPLSYYQNNLVSLIHLLEMIPEAAQFFVFSSSCTVYGQPDKLPVTEETPTIEAESVYGYTKQISEKIIYNVVKSKQKKLKSIMLRYFNPIGAHPSSLIGELPNGVPQNLVPFVTQTGAGLYDQITIFGDDYNTPDGTCIRDYIHVCDLAKAHVASLKWLMNTGSVGDKEKDYLYEIFNCGTGQGNSVLEIIQTFERVNNIKLNYTIGARRSGDIENIYADTSKANHILQWKTQKTLEDSLKDAWNWQLKLKKNS